MEEGICITVPALVILWVKSLVSSQILQPRDTLKFSLAASESSKLQFYATLNNSQQTRITVYGHCINCPILIHATTIYWFSMMNMQNNPLYPNQYQCLVSVPTYTNNIISNPR